MGGQLMSQKEFLLAVGENELAAGDRVLSALYLHDNPMVTRAVSEALDGLPMADFRRFCAHVHGARLAGITPEEADHE